MTNLNVHLDAKFFDMFRELKFFLKTGSNEDTQKKLIELVYKDLKEDQIKKLKEIRKYKIK